MYMLINYISVRAEAQNYQNLLILYVVSEKKKQEKNRFKCSSYFPPKIALLGNRRGGSVVPCLVNILHLDQILFF